MIIKLSVSASISMKNSASSDGSWSGVIIMMLSVSPTDSSVTDGVNVEILSSSVSASICDTAMMNGDVVVVEVNVVVVN